ncbi:MAG: hypothetical protein GX238_08030 [Epulopiscium sp.]|nr:hypothetical protein [Candidatus Epulonipiscium sp.]
MEPQKRRKKKKKYKKAKQNRIYIGFFVFMSLLFYLFGSAWTLAKKPSIPLEIVTLGSIEQKYTAQGLILRNEQIILSPSEGVLNCFYAEGEKIGKNSSLGSIQNKEFFSIVKRQLAQVDQDIQKIQEERKEFLWFQKDINQLNDKISTTLLNQNQVIKEDFYAIYTLKDQIQHYMDQRNQLFILEPKGRLKDLVTEKMQYENQLQQNSRLISAPISGLISYQVDGFESVTKENITLEHFKTKPDILQLNQGNEIQENKPILKIVEDTVWYISSLFPEEVAKEWEIGKQITLLFPEQNYFEIPFIIDTIKPLEENILVVFKSQDYMHLFLNQRFMDIQVLLEHYEGLKISNSSITQKTFLKIPKQCLIQSGKETGVIRIAGEESIFLPITITYEDEQSVYVPSNNELRQYDTLMIQKGGQQEKFTIEEINSSYGVYIANQGFAKFKKIEILGENKDYTIIRTGTPYGVQIYDRVILDANQVKDNQFLHKSS